MSKYNFTKLGSKSFEELVQSLLESSYRMDNGLVQFGDGKDAGREATFQLKADCTSLTVRNCIVQAKFHDIEQRGWTTARDAVVADLDKELDKIVNKYKHDCQRYVLVTNVPFTGVAMTGTKDRIAVIVKKWNKHISEIEVWDASDLSRMLDADSSTRTAFLDTILPGDVLKSIIESSTENLERRDSIFKAYLLAILQAQREAKAEEAGDEEGSLPMERIFMDLKLSLTDCVDKQLLKQIRNSTDSQAHEENAIYSPTSLEDVRSSFALLVAAYKSVLIVGGPGVGKSTITQLLALYQAARLTKNSLAKQLANRLDLPSGISSDNLDSLCEIRYPIRIELRRYAIWIAQRTEKEKSAYLAQYIIENINHETSGELSMSDLFFLTSRNPILLMLDGLDEVPNASARAIIFRELTVFLRRCEGEDADVQLILSTRPQGYRGEFQGFEPITWTVKELSREDFDKYADDWLVHRVKNPEERIDAKDRITVGMRSPAVEEMAKSLLQATVMLTIAKRKQAIPHARHKLFSKYVDVIFEREKHKDPTIRKHENELLRLHEKVGYKLIERAQYPDKPTTISDSEFKEYVERVLKEYGPTNRTIEEISTSVGAIIVLSRNRLCLLAGKGEEQENVDFVVQSFREYFAAAYMFNHEEKKSDSVFHNLIARRNVWANVFQFYIAFEDNQKQRNWISEVDQVNDDFTDTSVLTNRVRIRQEVLRVLPEFSGLTNRSEWQALLNIFDKRTRWTWVANNSAGRVLSVFGSGDHSEFLLQEFYPFELQDESQRNFEIETVIEHCGKVDKENTIGLIEGELDKHIFVNSAIDSCLRNNILVNVPNRYLTYYTNNLGRLKFRKTRYFHHGNRQNYNESDLVDEIGKLDERVLLTIWASEFGVRKLTDTISDSMPFTKELSEILTDTQIKDADEALFRVRTARHLVIDRDKIGNHLIESLQKIECPVSRYLVSLLKAHLMPLDADRYREAAEKERDVSKGLRKELNVVWQLGPSISQYKDECEWKKAHTQSSEFSKQLYSQLEIFLRNRELGILALSTKTEHWPIFKYIFSKEDYEQLNGNTKTWFDENGFGTARHFLIEPTRPFQITANDYVALLQAALMLSNPSWIMNGLNTNGSDYNFLINTRDWRHVFQNISPIEIRKLYEQVCLIKEYTLLIDYYLVMFISISEFTTEELVRLWGRHYEHEDCGTLIDLMIKSGVDVKSRVKEAIKLNTCQSITFAVTLFGTRAMAEGLAPFMEDCAAELVKAYNSSYNNAGTVFKKYLELTLTADHIDMEFILDAEKVQFYIEDANYLTKLRGMIESSAFEGNISNCSKNIEIIKIKILDRRKYPPVIQGALLDALLRFEEVNMPPLKECDWQ